MGKLEPIGDMFAPHTCISVNSVLVVQSHPQIFSVAIASTNLKIVVINSSYGADALVLVY